MTKVGFIGLGSQGAPIAQRIVQSGKFETAVWARREEALAPFRGGPAKIADSVAELAEGLDVLGTCVFDAAGTREILFGEGGAAHVMPKGAIVLCHSTVSPQEIADLATEGADHGLRVLDAPVSGGSVKAEIGELVVMIGGDEAAYHDALPVLETYSNLIVYLGGVGTGQQAKLLNNTALSAHLTIADAIFEIADKLGLDREGLGQVLGSGSGASFGLNIYRTFGSIAPMVEGPLKPALSKDVGLLDSVIAGMGVGESLMVPARKLIADLDRLAKDA